MASVRMSAVASTKFSTTSTAGYRMNQLLELTFSTPEGTGFINFNILRILLQEMVNKLELGDSFADDLDENQKLQIKTLQKYIANSQELEKGGGPKSGRRPKSPSRVKVVTQFKENPPSQRTDNQTNENKSQETVHPNSQQNESQSETEKVEIEVVVKNVEESKSGRESDHRLKKSNSIQTVTARKSIDSKEKLPSEGQITSDSLQSSEVKPVNVVQKTSRVSFEDAQRNKTTKETLPQTGQKTTDHPLRSDSVQSEVNVKSSQTAIRTSADETPGVNRVSSTVTSKHSETLKENPAKASIPQQQTTKSSTESPTNLLRPNQTIPLMFDGSMAHVNIKGQNKMSNPGQVQHHKSTSTLALAGSTKSELNLLKNNMKNLILLPKDLEDLRRQVKNGGKVPSVFDELDILERLHALWEAVNMLKHNDEALAVRMIKQDSSIAKIPKGENIEKIQKIPPEILDALISAPRHSNSISINVQPPSSTPRSNSITIQMARSNGQHSIHVDSDEVECKDDNDSDIENQNQSVQNCLNSLKTSDLLPRLCQVENTTVKRHDFIRLLLEKADKFDLDKKVDIEEFGNCLSDLTTRLSNLIIEFQEENEKFRTSVNNLENNLQSRASKSDVSLLKNIVIAQIKILEQKVKCLAEHLDQPDPAGTRKKLLKDYNCLSCDRMANISGVTNCSRVPTFGAPPTSCGQTKNISAEAQRAYDLHQLRQQKEQKQQQKGNKCDGGININLLSKELQYYGMRGRETGTGKGSSNFKSAAGSTGEESLVNRYVGGSHTAVRASRRVTATHRKTEILKSSDSFDDAYQ